MVRGVVIGRGKSLALWNAIPAKPRFDLMYLVNDCSEEVRRVGITSDDADRIEHVFGRKNATLLDTEIYELLGIKRAWVNAQGCERIENMKRITQNIPVMTAVHTRPGCMVYRGCPPIGWKKILRGVTEAAPKSDNGNCWPTTGLYAIDLMLMQGVKEIWLFGFDFYSRPYLIKPNRSYQNHKNPKIKMMYVYLQRLVEEFPEVQFYSVTDLLEAKNWHRIQ